MTMIDYLARKADRETAIRVLSDLIARENDIQLRLAGPLLRESRSKVQTLLAAHALLLIESI